MNPRAEISMATDKPTRIPIVDYLQLGSNPHLQANQCVNCGARFFDRRNACAQCGMREFTTVNVDNKATLKAFTIVHRAAPTISVPYVSAIVETSDGTTVRSNLLNCDPNPEKVQLGMKLELTTYPIGTDDEGTEAIAFGYQPA